MNTTNVMAKGQKRIMRSIDRGYRDTCISFLRNYCFDITDDGKLVQKYRRNRLETYSNDKLSSLRGKEEREIIKRLAMSRHKPLPEAYIQLLRHSPSKAIMEMTRPKPSGWDDRH